MKECPFCKTELDDDVLKCKNCGEWVNKPVEQREFSSTIAIAFFLGFLGIHRFYTGYKKIGIAQLVLTLSLFGFVVSAVWSFIDIITICLDKYKDANGKPLLNYDKTFGTIILVIAVLGFLVTAYNGIEGWNNTSTSSVSQGKNEENKVSIPSAKEDLEVVEHYTCKTEFGSSAVCGVIRNNTNKEYGYVQIEVNFYDDNGTLIESSLDNINNFEPQGKWKFQVAPMTEGYSSYKIKDITNW